VSALRIAFQGEHGAFSEEAALVAFGGDITALPQPDFAAVARAVVSGAAAFGMLPVENSIAGGVAPAYDVLASASVSVVGEIISPIRLCLMAPPGASIEHVRRVLSHPVALAQCQIYLQQMRGADAIAVHDTAGAARIVAQHGDPAEAAVAPRGAAQRYALELLAEDIQDRDDNQTRFFVIAPRGTAALPSRSNADVHRTALLLETAHRAGALVDALTPFAQHGINLSRIESRPADQPWHYRFFLELDADAASAETVAAIADVTQRAHLVHVLGTFRRLP
jgi:prephenate dehydratase